MHQVETGLTFCAAFLFTMLDDYRHEILDLTRLERTNDVACPPFNECVYSGKTFMPTRRPRAIRRNYNSFITVLLIGRIFKPPIQYHNQLHSQEGRYFANCS